MSGIDVQSHLHTGQLCLPDKEFRSKRFVTFARIIVSGNGLVVSASLPMSP